VFVLLIIPFKGEQNRRRKDELDLVEQRNIVKIPLSKDEDAEAVLQKDV